MSTIDHLARLIRRVPVHHIDVAEATEAGDVEALWYARDIAKWLSEAAIALSEVSEDGKGGSGARKVGDDRPSGDLAPELVSARDFLGSTSRGLSADGDRLLAASVNAD